MDREWVRQREARCIEDEPPACVTACPVHLDARAIAGHLSKGQFDQGLAVFRKFVRFPSIISRICDRPCEAACRRAEAGDAVRLNALERACVDHGSPPTTTARRPPGRHRFAVVGAGLGGLAAAAELAAAGHRVVVYEAADVPLPRLRSHPALPPALIEDDLRAIAALGVAVDCSVRIGGGGPTLPALLGEFDAVYLATGDQSWAGTAPGLAVDRDGRPTVDPLTLATTHPKLFAGGSLRRPRGDDSPIGSLHDGRSAAASIERLVQGASLSANRERQGPYPSRLFVNTGKFPVRPAIAPAAADGGYGRDEATAEAGRCFPCQCLECVEVCHYLAHYESYPKRYVRQIFNNDSIVLGNRSANRLVNSCALCGLCEAVCPQGLGMAEVCLEARRSMVDKGRMPPSAHDFALRDMAFSRSDAFRLVRHQPGWGASAAAFLPGCQLGGSAPDRVAAIYAHLCDRIPGGVGLLLGCCGAPAHWAGRQDLFAEALADLRDDWLRLGRPRLITACATCTRMLGDHLPELTVVSLWPLLEETGLPAPRPDWRGRRFALHDPCTTRDDPEIAASVRRIVAGLGIEAVELDGPALTSCCGFGGLQQFANRPLADTALDRRAKREAAAYLAYCAMCRDNFARRGKPAAHLLDLLLASPADNPAARPDPGYSDRRRNRSRLKRRLLRELWGEDAMDENGGTVTLVIPDGVRALMEERMILADEVRAVIDQAEATGRKIESEGRILASLRQGEVTTWVEYSADGGAFLVHGAYSHRMLVEG